MSQPDQIAPLGAAGPSGSAAVRAAIARASGATGVDFRYLLAEARLESGLDPKARAGTNAAARSDLQRPSMGQDMRKGRRTEIEFMNGFIASEAARVGMRAPTHEMLTRQVLRVERGEIPARPENVLVNS